MLALWMGYAALVGLAAVGTAALFERGLRRRRRWLWATAELVALALPLVRPLLHALGAGAGAIDVAFGPVAPAVRRALPTLGALGSAAASSNLLEALEGPLIGAWVGASLVLAVVVVGGVLRIRRVRRGWSRGIVDGTEVLLSETLGPAVVGVRRADIVLPSWALALGPGERALILAHENEHRRSGDPALLLAALAVPVLLPWNPAAWLAFARLRVAVETDCDARVLARGRRKPLQYARLLLDVGARTVDAVPVGAGFSERASSLERRIRTMLGKTIPFGWKGLSVRAALAALVVAAACSLDVNVQNTGEEPTGVAPAATADGPTFTPFTVAPSILNRDEIVQAMEREYPPLLRDAGIGGTVKMYFFIDETGTVQDVRIDESSGHPALDDAAIRVASRYRFGPALNRDEKVPVWVSFPITFQVR